MAFVMAYKWGVIRSLLNHPLGAHPPSRVGKYSSPMEHVGLDIMDLSPRAGFPKDPSHQHLHDVSGDRESRSFYPSICHCYLVGGGKILRYDLN